MMRVSGSLKLGKVHPIQLNRGESRHSLTRPVFYGKKSELHQGREDQLIS